MTRVHILLQEMETKALSGESWTQFLLFGSAMYNWGKGSHAIRSLQGSHVSHSTTEDLIPIMVQVYITLISSQQTVPTP